MTISTSFDRTPNKDLLKGKKRKQRKKRKKKK